MTITNVAVAAPHFLENAGDGDFRFADLELVEKCWVADVDANRVQAQKHASANYNKYRELAFWRVTGFWNTFSTRSGHTASTLKYPQIKAARLHKI